MQANNKIIKKKTKPTINHMHHTPDTLRALGIDPTGLTFFRDQPPYDPTLKANARDLRTYGVKAEAYLWKMLKHSQSGYKFTRQKPILHYIADFYCHELHLVVEIDGSSHNHEENIQHDRRRDHEMRLLGLKVVRIWDHDVLRYPLATVGRIFHEAGVDIPAAFSGLNDGSEKIWSPFC